MKLITAKLCYLRTAPRKVRLVADLVRGKKVEEAETILKFTIKRGAEPLLKLLKQAMANAKNNQIEPSTLYISKIVVDEGPKLKRWRARSKGRAFEIQKKTSHITLVLDVLAGKKLTKINQKIEAKEKRKKGEKVKKEKPKFKPTLEIKKNKVEKGIKKIFRRKAF